MTKKKVLFVCIHNSARSQMAEELLKLAAGDQYEVKSAGLEPGKINPYTIEVLKEKGIDISTKETIKVFDLYKTGETFHYVVTVCDESNAERCPIFPNVIKTLHWSFEDPSSFKGSHEEKLVQFREVRDNIEDKIRKWVENEE